MSSNHRVVVPGLPQGLEAFNFGFELLQTWRGLPGKVLRFRLRMYLSGELAEKRQSTIGLGQDERSARLLDFRVRILSDALLAPPDVAEIAQERAEGEAEVWEPMPGFPASVRLGGAESTALADRAYAYFSTTDLHGSRVFQFLTEAVVNAYWEAALPGEYFRPAQSPSAAGRSIPSQAEEPAPGI